MKALILAGGVGSRMKGLTKDIPKPMLKVGSTPVLEHQIRLLARYGLTEIILCTGYLSNVIEEYFKDGSGFGVKIGYAKEDEPLGSAGCLNLVRKELDDDFLIINGDIMLDLDLEKLVKYHEDKKADATLTIHPNDHPYDSDLLETDEQGRITAFHPKPRPEDKYYQNLVNAGAYVLSKKIFAHIPGEGMTDLGRDVFPQMVAEGARVFGYNTPEYIKDMGTPERLEEVNHAYEQGIVSAHNLENKRPAIFLDRDGVINEEKDLLHTIEDFELIDGSAEAVRKINRAGYLCIVITNQPVVARGLCTIREVELIHNKMETLLGRRGAKLDAIYYCPHHPDKGYPEEDTAYKIDCECRKPKIGMIMKAAREFNIDMDGSYMIGDSSRDILAGANAHLTTVCVKTGHAGADGKYEIKPDYTYASLLDAVESLLEGSSGQDI
ncbi:D-glycero-beta-D-manno-heptose 1,7-bisphosphate 7-phosphatase [Candidatus Altiarchaeota archaeon]